MTQRPDNHSFKALSATPATFELDGGIYGCTFVAASWGTVTLEVLAEDGSTYLAALTAWSANGVVNGTLPPGTYKLVLSGATGVYVGIKRARTE